MLEARKPAASQGAGSWLRCFQPNPQAKMRLVCFPFAGGGANFYRAWASHFPKSVEVHAVQLPGREMRMKERAVVSASAVSDAVADELSASYRRQPIVFFGHSMGSMLAYDTALKLKQRHQWEPKLFIASGRPPPHLHFGGDFHRQPEDVFIAEIKRLNGTPPGVLEDEEMRAIVLPMLRSDYEILETYRVPTIGAGLTCPMVTCVGDSDTEATPSDMENWSQLTQGACIHRVFSGDHFYLKDRLPLLADFLNDCLLRWAPV